MAGVGSKGAAPRDRTQTLLLARYSDAAKDETPSELETLRAQRGLNKKDSSDPHPGQFTKILERKKGQLIALGLLRLKSDGHGTNIVNCDFCGMSSIHTDKLFTDCFVIWIELDEKGSVKGTQCKWCSDIFRRRWKGWKAKRFQDELATNETVNKQFFELVAKSLDGYRSGMMNITDKFLSTPLQTVENNTVVEDTISIPKLLYPPPVFKMHFPNITNPKVMLKAEWYSKVDPRGGRHEGWLLDDNGQRPLQDGVMIVNRALRMVWVSKHKACTFETVYRAQMRGNSIWRKVLNVRQSYADTLRFSHMFPWLMTMLAWFG